MQAQFTRLFTDERGIPCFEDMETELIPGFAVPPADPLHTASFLMSDGATFWIGAPTDWKGGMPHPAPRRMIFFTTRGEFEVTTAEGVVRRFPTGSVLIVEDTTGRGHSSKITGGEDLVVLAVGLPPA